MLNINELRDMPEEAQTTLIVIALVEQRMVLERIAELLELYAEKADSSDSMLMAASNFAETSAHLDRIAGALEERNNAFKTVVSERPDMAAEPG